MKTPRRLTTWNLFLAVILTGLIHGAGSPPPGWSHGGPPLLTDTTEPTPAGEWVVTIDSALEARRKERLIEALRVEVAHGITDDLEIAYSVPWLVLDPDDDDNVGGLGNSTLNVKWRFYHDEDRGMAAAITPTLETNNTNSSVDHGLVDDGTAALLPLEFLKRWGRFGVNPEIGYHWTQYGEDEWIYGLAFGYDASDRLELLAEINGATARDFDGSETVYQVGARYALLDNLILLLSAGRGFEGDPQLLLFAGLEVGLGGRPLEVHKLIGY